MQDGHGGAAWQMPRGSYRSSLWAYQSGAIFRLPLFHIMKLHNQNYLIQLNMSTPKPVTQWDRSDTSVRESP